jgi:hypothetical protein
MGFTILPVFRSALFADVIGGRAIAGSHTI